MNTNSIPDSVIDQLRGNLRAAGIQASDTDIQGIIEKGFLIRLLDFERVIEHIPSDTLPDYLNDWSYIPSEEHQPNPMDNAIQRPSSPISQIAAQLHTRQVSPVELTERALERIATRDPLLNAFQLVLADQARAAAQRAEHEIATGNYRGPLHGVPIAIKDLIAMTGTLTTAGSKILANNLTDFNAAAVDRLNAAGAIIVGKTRLSEFAYSPGSNNAHYGPTHNPRDLERDAGGSSSGSAAAVADDLVYAALGSDTGGSIRIPAAFCGIVGMKPTFGRISLHGVVPLAWSLDHLGPLTRSVADAALIIDALAGYDARDTRTRQYVKPPLPGDWAAGAHGIRIGVLGDDGSNGPLGSSMAISAWQNGLKALEDSGAELVAIDVPELEQLRILNGVVLALEASAYHYRNLRTRLDDYGEFMRQRVLAAFAYGPRAFAQAQQARTILRLRINSIFQRIDLLSTPTMPDSALALGTPASTAFTSPFNLLGWPTISVPLSAADSLPFGLQLIGKPWDEATMLRAAHALEMMLA